MGRRASSRRERKQRQRERRMDEFAQHVRHELGAADAPFLSGKEKEAVLGPKKISDTLVEYALPLTTLMPSDHDADDFEAVLQLAADIWNASTRKGFPGAVFSRITLWLAKGEIASRVGVTNEEAGSLIDQLVKSRLEIFGDVKYRFGPVKVSDMERSQFYVQAAAVISSSEAAKTKTE